MTINVIRSMDNVKQTETCQICNNKPIFKCIKCGRKPVNPKKPTKMTLNELIS